MSLVFSQLLWIIFFPFFKSLTLVLIVFLDGLDLLALLLWLWLGASYYRSLFGIFTFGLRRGLGTVPTLVTFITTVIASIIFLTSGRPLRYTFS